MRRSIGDNRSTIRSRCLFHGRAIVPNSSTRSASGGVLWFSAVGLTGCGGFRRRSIGDNRSTIRSRCVFHGRAIVPNSSTRRASVGVLRFFGCWLYRVAAASGADRLGTIDLPYARGGCFEPSDSFSAFLTLRSAGGFTRTLALARPLAESLLRSLGPAPRTLPILRANTTAGAPWAPLLVMH